MAIQSDQDNPAQPNPVMTKDQPAQPAPAPVQGEVTPEQKAVALRMGAEIKAQQEATPIAERVETFRNDMAKNSGAQAPATTTPPTPAPQPAELSQDNPLVQDWNSRESRGTPSRGTPVQAGQPQANPLPVIRQVAPTIQPAPAAQPAQQPAPAPAQDNMQPVRRTVRTPEGTTIYAVQNQSQRPKEETQWSSQDHAAAWGETAKRLSTLTQGTPEHTAALDERARHGAQTVLKSAKEFAKENAEAPYEVASNYIGRANALEASIKGKENTIRPQDYALVQQTARILREQGNSIQSAESEKQNPLKYLEGVAKNIGAITPNAKATGLWQAFTANEPEMQRRFAILGPSGQQQFNDTKARLLNEHLNEDAARFRASYGQMVKSPDGYAKDGTELDAAQLALGVEARKEGTTPDMLLAKTAVDPVSGTPADQSTLTPKQRFIAEQWGKLKEQRQNAIEFNQRAEENSDAITKGYQELAPMFNAIGSAGPDAIRRSYAAVKSRAKVEQNLTRKEDELDKQLFGVVKLKNAYLQKEKDHAQKNELESSRENRILAHEQSVALEQLTARKIALAAERKIMSQMFSAAREAVPQATEE